MKGFRKWSWIVLTVAFGLAIPAAHAEWITPDSIPNPPSAVGSANGTSVSQSNLVSGQYAGLGLNFSGGAAITQLNGVSVWAPVGLTGPPDVGLSGDPPVNSPLRTLSYYGSVTGKFVSPGTLNPTTVSSMSVRLVGNQPLSMSVYDINGRPLHIAPIIQSLAGTETWTFTGPGISWFSAVPVSPPVGAHPDAIPYSVWGVSGVSFAHASAPEPSSLVLAGLGALGLATRLAWRRIRRVA